MKKLRAAFRKFLFTHLEQFVQYHPYGAGYAAGYAGYYTLFGKAIAFDATDGETYRQPYFGW